MSRYLKDSIPLARPARTFAGIFVGAILIQAGALTAATKIDELLAKAQAAFTNANKAEAIALAVEQSATRLLVDEHRARVVASRLGVRTIGCLGILLEAKQHGLIATIRPLLDKLETQAGFWVGGELRSQVLSTAGE